MTLVMTRISLFFAVSASAFFAILLQKVYYREWLYYDNTESLDLSQLWYGIASALVVVMAVCAVWIFKAFRDLDN